MSIVAECPSCGKRFKADEKQAGKKAKCSGCALVFVIGAGASDQVGAGALPLSTSLMNKPAPAAKPSPAAVPTPTIQKSAPAAKPSTAGVQPRITQKPAPKPAAQTVAPTIAIAPVKTSANQQVAVARVAVAQPALQPKPLPAPVDVPADDNAQAPPVRPASRGKWLAVAGLLISAGVAAAIVLPKILNKSGNTNQPTTANPNPTGAIVHQVAQGLNPRIQSTGPAWSIAPDGPQKRLDLPADYRLSLKPQPNQKYVARTVVLGKHPGAFAAIGFTSEAGGDLQGYEIWNLSTQKMVGTIKPGRQLNFVSLSENGSYFAGQWYDEAAKINRVEIWLTDRGLKLQTVEIPGGPLAYGAVVGFGEFDVTILGDRLQNWDLKNKTSLYDIAAPPHSEDTRIAISADQKLLVTGDSRGIYLVDLTQKKVIGNATIPDALCTHPRRRLSLRTMQFSPDGKEIALVFDNRQSVRRLAIFDVATGQITAMLTPSTPVFAGGPDLQWLGDGRAFMVGSGVLLDRDTSRQIGQVFGDVPDEGLGGQLVSLVASDRALMAWDRKDGGVNLRTTQVSRENPKWIKANIESATAGYHRELQCVSAQFGNDTGVQHLRQTGRLTDGSVFYVIDVSFSAELDGESPDLVQLRQDQFILLADGQPRAPIGTLNGNGGFVLEKPEYTLRRGATLKRQRSIVFTGTGQEKSLKLMLADAQFDVAPAPAATSPKIVQLRLPQMEKMDPKQFESPDNTSMFSVGVASARLNVPFELDPEMADYIPLRIVYSSNDWMLFTVRMDVTVNSARAINRGVRTENPKIGLLLPDGSHLRPAAELPGQLPALMSAGERRSHTVLFLLDHNPGRFRLTVDNAPVAKISPEGGSARLGN